MATPKDVGHGLQCVPGLTNGWIAGGANEIEKTSAVIDRAGYSSAKVIVEWNAQAVTDKKKLTIVVKRYQSSDNSAWDAGTVILTSDVFTAANPTLAGAGHSVVNENFDGITRYVKYSVTGTLNQGNTDTASYGLMIVLGGAATEPTTL
jgi:hypothetical protein